MLCFKIAKWLSMENVVGLVELRIKGHTPTMSEGGNAFKGSRACPLHELSIMLLPAPQGD